MSSPGAGKTTLLKETIWRLKDTVRCGVIEADIDSDVDARTIAQLGVPAVQVHTGGECAMDAAMTMQAIDEFGAGDLDLLFLENVGNLVCPAEQDTGSKINVEILSVPEGIHDFNPDAKIIFLSGKTGEGFEEWISWLRQQFAAAGKKEGGQE